MRYALNPSASLSPAAVDRSRSSGRNGKSSSSGRAMKHDSAPGPDGFNARFLKEMIGFGLLDLGFSTW